MPHSSADMMKQHLAYFIVLHAVIKDMFLYAIP